MYWKHLWRWLSDAPALWWFVSRTVFIVLTSATLRSFWSLRLEAFIRLTGLLLLVAGAYVTLKQISDNREILGLPSFWHESLLWLRAFPIRRPQKIVASMGSALGEATVNGRLRALRTPSHDDMLERLTALEENQKQIFKEMDGLEDLINNAKADVLNRLAKETASLTSENAQIASNLRRTTAEGVGRLVTAFFWAATGSSLTAMPIEFCTLIFGAAVCAPS